MKRPWRTIRSAGTVISTLHWFIWNLLLTLLFVFAIWLHVLQQKTTHKSRVQGRSSTIILSIVDSQASPSWNCEDGVINCLTLFYSLQIENNKSFRSSSSLFSPCLYLKINALIGCQEELDINYGCSPMILRYRSFDILKIKNKCNYEKRKSWT